jgi:hypothetical protein
MQKIGDSQSGLRALADYSPRYPRDDVRFTSTCEQEGHRQYVVTDSSLCSTLVSMSICPYWQIGHSLVEAGLMFAMARKFRINLALATLIPGKVRQSNAPILPGLFRYFATPALRRRN